MKRISGDFNKYQTLLLALAVSLNASQVLAEEKDGSLNEMWSDKSILEKPLKDKTKPLDTDTNFKIVTPNASLDELSKKAKAVNADEKTDSTIQNKSNSNESGTSDTSAAETKTSSTSQKNAQVIKHLCTVSDLKGSVLVKSGGWPGVGPFKSSQDESTTFLDNFNNRIDLKANGDKVSKAELKLVNISSTPSDLLTLQMSTDFFLEALGAKSGKIANFNSVFAEKQGELATGGAQQLTLSAGPLEVSINKKNSNSDKSEVLISVVNTELIDKEETPAPQPVKPENTSSTVMPSATKISAPESTGKKPETQPIVSVLDKPVSFHLQNNDSTKAKTTSPANTTTQSSSPDLLKQKFTKLIETWQSVKRRAVKNRQKQNLFEILGGKALTRQSQAIKWLLDNHRYYEMTPKSLKLERYKEITPKKKYEVVAKISERRKFIDANKMRILKDTTTTYTVSYIVENIRGQWLITDSKVLK